MGVLPAARNTVFGTATLAIAAPVPLRNSRRVIPPVIMFFIMFYLQQHATKDIQLGTTPFDRYQDPRRARSQPAKMNVVRACLSI